MQQAGRMTTTGRTLQTHVDDGQDTAEDVRQPVLETDRPLKQDGSVVNDGIAASELLEDLGGSTDEGSAEMLVLAALEDLAPGRLVGLLRGDGVGDPVTLRQCLVAVDRHTLEGCHHAQRLLVVPVSHEPSWGFRQDSHTGEEDEGKEDLEGDGETPRHVGLHDQHEAA